MGFARAQPILRAGNAALPTQAQLFKRRRSFALSWKLIGEGRDGFRKGSTHPTGYVARG